MIFLLVGILVLISIVCFMAGFRMGVETISDAVSDLYGPETLDAVGKHLSKKGQEKR